MPVFLLLLARLSAMIRGTEGDAARPHDEPHEQVRVLSDEAARQIQAVSERQANYVMRATVLVAASGVLAAYTATLDKSLYIMLAIAISAACCILGILAMWPWRSNAAKLTHEAAQSRLKYPAFRVELAIMNERLYELHAARKDLAVKGWLVMVGFLLLPMSWACMIIAAFK